VVIGSGVYIFGITKKGKVKYIKRALVKINKGDNFAIWQSVYSREVNDWFQLTLPRDLAITQLSNDTIHCQYGPHPVFQLTKPEGAHSHAMFFDHVNKAINHVTVYVNFAAKTISYKTKKYPYWEDVDAFSDQPAESQTFNLSFPVAEQEYTYESQSYTWTKDFTKYLAPASHKNCLAVPVYNTQSEQWVVLLRYRKFSVSNIHQMPPSYANPSLATGDFHNGWTMVYGTQRKFMIENWDCPEYVYGGSNGANFIHNPNFYTWTQVISAHLGILPHSENYWFLHCGTQKQGSLSQHERYGHSGSVSV